jgi:Holliday junction resolvase RusA-like endonuclease
MAIVTCTLPIPPSVNSIWRVSNGRIRKSAKYREWLTCCDLSALQARVPRPSISKPCSIEVIVRTGHGWRGSRDIDNLLKPILDWLVRWNILAGDDCSVVRQILISIDPLPRPVACVDITIAVLS